MIAETNIATEHKPPAAQSSRERPLRIAIVAPGIPERSTGPSSWVRDLTHQLCESGHEVTVVTSDLTTGSGAPGPMVEIDPRATARAFPVTSKLARRAYYSGEMKRWMKREIKNFDVVDIQGTWSFVAADCAASCMRSGVPYIFTTHGQMASWDWAKNYWRKRLFFELFLRRAWRGAAAVRSVSLGESRSCVEPAAGNATIIPYFVGQPATSASANSDGLLHELGIPAGAEIVLFLGRITAQKGVLQILEAFDRQWQRRRESFLLLVGPRDQDYAAALIDRLDKLACKSNVRVLDPVYGAKKEQLFGVASLFITISRNEGLPIAVLEAMAHGLPVVITDKANMPEAADFGAGVVVDSEPASIASALENLLSSPAQLSRMGMRAQQLVRERFTAAVVMPQLLSLYRGVATRRASGGEIALGDANGSRNGASAQGESK
jgi:glycosyltransferase involved in cell wall biosynthesis